jgi:hypothetical protein
MSWMPVPGRDFELAPAGTLPGVCFRVLDIGSQPTTWLGKTKMKRTVMIAWELTKDQMSDGRPFMVSRRYTFSNHRKSNLRTNLEAWRGAPFEEKDFGPGGFNLKYLLGKCCLLNIVHNTKQNGTFANVKGVMRVMKGQPLEAQPVNPPLYLWLQKDIYDAATFDKLSDKMKATIMVTKEYKKEVLGIIVPDDNVPDDGGDLNSYYNEGYRGDEPPDHEEFVDDIPF